MKSAQDKDFNTVPLAKLLGLAGGLDIPVRMVTADSRAVEPGDMFVALPGLVADGRHFIKDAVARGAVAVLSTPDAAPLAQGAIFIADTNPRRRYAEVAARFYGSKQPEYTVAVTGTNGKSSVVDFTRQIWEGLGINGASLGTIGVQSRPVTKPGGLTTPDAMAVMEVLAELAESGVTHAAMEASSHGLSQYRLDGVRIRAAAFTNLSRDHLDYHSNFESYFYAKARLFGELLLPRDVAVIHCDEERGRMLQDLAWGRGLRSITYGRGESADMRIEALKPSSSGLDVGLNVFGGKHRLHLPLIGGFQMENALAALGLVHGVGGDIVGGLKLLEGLRGVSGRMEFLSESPAGGRIYLDYAHTPAGLETALRALAAHKPAGISLVFGCGGDRDKGKRAEMGAIAAELASHVYVTDDNPRSEDPATIRAAICAAVPAASEIGDRGEAIRAAITDLKAGEMLLIAGKGHEEGQIVGDQVLPFSDTETVLKFLNGDTA